ncbi:putative lysine transport system substrate-binding protein [Oscillibacter sp. PC13]|nr:putative lysine transport system substrate-binding protein [Oscillibacter sp. PC13]
MDRLTERSNFLFFGADVCAKYLISGKVIEMKKFLSLLMAAAICLSLAACGGSGDSSPADTEPPAGTETPADAGAAASGVEDGVFTVGMECAYAPYNWTQMDDSNGAVPISNVPGSYANGYDVMIAKKIAEANGWELEIVSSAWDSLCPAVQSGTMDANIAGQSMTADRMEQVDMAGPYYYATIVCVTTKDSPYASATSIADLAGGKCTAQSGTIWYDSCLPQIENAQLQSPAETAPAMIMSLQTGTVDFICTDMPTAMGAAAKDDSLVILNFSGTDGDFQFATEEERAENVNIGISVAKGNTVLKDAIDSVLSCMTEDDFNALMDEAISVQPEI